MGRVIRQLLLLTMTILVTADDCAAARIYFTDQPVGGPGSIISIAPDGTDQRTLLTTNGSDLRGIAYHPASARVYFLDNGSKRIYSMLTNGDDHRTVVSVNSSLLGSDLEIDESAGRIYWSESNAGTSGNGLVRRANLDGAGAEDAVLTDPGVYTTPYFIFVDTGASYIYWGVLSSGSDSSSFRRSTFAGVIDPDFIITSPTRTRDIAIDPTSGTAYWCDRQTGNIFKRELNGTVNQTVISGMNAPHGIALDIEAEKVYWADTGQRGGGPFNTSARRVARCNFDGSQYESLSTPAANSEPWDLALDTSSPTYGEWRARFFMASALNFGPTEDADADGAVNLLEYAMGTHPGKAASVPRITPEPDGLRYTRRRVSNLNYRVEVSTNLVVWNHNFDGTGQIWTAQTLVTPLTPDLELVTITRGPALSKATQAFFRVRVATP